MITALLVSLVLLVLNAFFVAAEFALVASKRHRLDELAERGSRAAAAAAAGSRSRRQGDAARATCHGR